MDNKGFFKAVKEGNLPIVKQILEEGKLNLNQRDSDERTPFHWACSHGHVDIASELAKRFFLNSI